MANPFLDEYRLQYNIGDPDVWYDDIIDKNYGAIRERANSIAQRKGVKEVRVLISKTYIYKEFKRD